MNIMNKWLGILYVFLQHNYSHIYDQKYGHKYIINTLKITCITVFSFYTLLFIVAKSIDPDFLKSKIEKEVLEKTGKTLIIKGPIQINTFPSIHISAEETTLKEKPNRKPIFKTEKLIISPSLRYLLIGKLALKLKFTDLKISDYFFPTLKTRLSFKGGIVKFSNTALTLKNPKKQEIAQEIISIDTLEIHTNHEIPKYHLFHQSKDFSIKSVLKAFNLPESIHGNTELLIDLFSEGLTIPAIKQNLAGQIEVQISKGKIYGTDLIGAFEKSRTIITTISFGMIDGLLKVLETIKIKKDTSESDMTPFDSLILHAKIQKGIIENHTLNVSHHRYSLNGKGKIHLVPGTLDYQITALYRDKRDKVKHQEKLNKTPLLLYVTGPCDNPSIRPDWKSYLQRAEETKQLKNTTTKISHSVSSFVKKLEKSRSKRNQ